MNKYPLKTPGLLLIFLCIACTPVKDPAKESEQVPEMEARLTLAYDRILFGKNPELTEEFLLACLNQDKKFERRFTDFSGDQPGRYLSIISLRNPEGNPIDHQKFVMKVIGLQHPDGRFGNADLIFEPDQISGEHMALLWGNGRLFAGLLDYYLSYKKEEALTSARKLGDFLNEVTEACITPANIERLKGMGAMGFICFTQNIEGLVKLYQITGEQKYLNLAEKIYPLLPPMGNQHSHGFLNTLRGVLLLYNATGKKEQLDFVKERYAQVIQGKEFMLTGGVPEFFGSYNPKEGYRDEGCSEADFLMLSLALWRTTRDPGYLNRAEYCLLNEMYYNQYCTGDFGSHQIDTSLGFRSYYVEDRAWWCCTYHGIMGLSDAAKAVVTGEGDTRRLNLFVSHQYSDEHVSLRMEKSGNQPGLFNIFLDASDGKIKNISIRKPFWAESMDLRVNDEPISCGEEGGYLVLNREWKKNDRISIAFSFKLEIINRQRERISPENLTKAPLNGALLYGPYLLAVDDHFNWEFMSEPGSDRVFLDVASPKPPARELLDSLKIFTDAREGYLLLRYRHTGYYGEQEVLMRPVSENSFQQPANVQLWFRLQKP